MSLSMTTAERAAFLAERHVGVLAVSEDRDRGPLTVPVWYAYKLDGEVRFITGASTRKARLLRRAGRATLVAQSEEPPYKYVAVEGPVEIQEGIDPAERRAIAHRYLGVELGDAYVTATEEEAASSVTVMLRPQHWLSVDYAKQFS